MKIFVKNQFMFLELVDKEGYFVLLNFFVITL